MPDYSEQLKQAQEMQRQVEELQQQEAAMSRQLLCLGRRLLLPHLRQLKPASLAHIERILNLSSRLAALAAARAAQRPQVTAEDIARADEIDAALEKGYGAMAKSGVIPNVREEIERERAADAQSPGSTPPTPSSRSAQSTLKPLLTIDKTMHHTRTPGFRATHPVSRLSPLPAPSNTRGSRSHPLWGEGRGEGEPLSSKPVTHSSRCGTRELLATSNSKINNQK